MNKFPDEVVKYLLFRVRRDGDHIFWDQSRGRFRFKRVHYKARNVLWGDNPKPNMMWKNTCGVEGCIARPHTKLVPRDGRPGQPLRATAKQSRQKYTHCVSCGGRLRPHGRKAADYPGTKAHAMHGRCHSCYSNPHTAYVKPKFTSSRAEALWDNLLPPGDKFEFDPEVVHRNVPSDLWWQFGVK